MLNKPGGYRAVVIALTVLCMVWMVGANAKGRDNNAGTLKIASFDPDRLNDEYKYTVETNKALQKKEEDTRFMLQNLAQNALLTEADQKRLADLSLEERNTGANFDAGRQSELKKLKEQSRQLSDEFTSLQGNQNPNPQQQTRLQVLTRAYSDTSARLETVRKTITGELQKQQADSASKIIKDMREAIAQVAKAKGISLVLPNNVAWFSDSDITDAVLANMNGKK